MEGRSRLFSTDGEMHPCPLIPLLGEAKENVEAVSIVELQIDPVAATPISVESFEKFLD